MFWTGYLWFRAATALPLGVAGIGVAIIRAAGRDWTYAVFFASLGVMLICVAPVLLIGGGTVPDAPVLAQHRGGATLWGIAVSRWWFTAGMLAGILAAASEGMLGDGRFAVVCLGGAGAFFVLMALRAASWGENLFSSRAARPRHRDT